MENNWEVWKKYISGNLKQNLASYVSMGLDLLHLSIVVYLESHYIQKLF